MRPTILICVSYLTGKGLSPQAQLVRRALIIVACQSILWYHQAQFRADSQRVLAIG